MSSSTHTLVLRKLLGEELLRCKRRSGGKAEENGKNGESSPGVEEKNGGKHESTDAEDADDYDEEKVSVSVAFESAEGVGEGEVGGDVALEGGKVLGLYFCSSWCPPCMNFRPQLESFYRNVRKGAWEKNFEIVTVATDEEEVGFRMTFRGSPWFALPFRDRERKVGVCSSSVELVGA
ncbi:uncharacterized protein [Hetaerina americana]|uniref:uncharacterized protein n=1 Tax=Hetaerina americana TaxID=62018 RepID=UPI003A7F25EF